MVSKKVKIINKTGLHLRPAGILSRIASSCTSSIIIIKDDKRINAKSVLNIMSAQINFEDQIVVECTGENEASDLQIIVEALQNGLGQ